MTAPITPTADSAPDRGLRLGTPQIAQLCAALVAFVAVLFVPAVLNDGDTYWHLAAGEWMLAHGQVLRRDVFSFSHAGQPWDTHEWLTEVVMALAFRLGAWNGLLLLAASAAAAAAALIARSVGRVLSGVTLAAVLLMAAGCIAPSLLVRPHLLILPIMVGWLAELLAARDADRAPHWLVVPAMLLWANLHGSYVFGLLFFGVFALEALVAAGPEWPRVFRGWGLIGVGCGLATLATPHGLNAFVYPFQIMGMSTLGAITEWRPADFSHITPFEVALLTTIFVCLSRGVRVPPIRLAALVLMLFMALQHDRHQLVLAAMAPLVLAGPLAEALGQTPPAQRGGRLALLLAGVAALVLTGVRWAWPAARHDDAVTPAAALAHVPPALAAQPLINSYGFGGYLIFRGVKPFIDGRSDMYGDAYFARHLRIVGGDMKAFDAAVRQYGVGWTLLTPTEPLARMLDTTPGWRRVYADRFAVLHVRATHAVTTSDGHGNTAR
jgi:hypothetical protein